MASATTSAFVKPGETTLTVTAANKTGSVSLKRDGHGAISFSDGTNALVFPGKDDGIAKLFETLSALPDA